jgi:hypothetical protein
MSEVLALQLLAEEEAAESRPSLCTLSTLSLNC